MKYYKVIKDGSSFDVFVGMIVILKNIGSTLNEYIIIEDSSNFLLNERVFINKECVEEITDIDEINRLDKVIVFK